MKKNVIKWIQITIYICMGLQIVLGLLWAFSNLGNLPRFIECEEILAMSESLVVDEYTGYLYPLLIRGFGVFASISGIQTWSVLYVLQLAIAYGAYDYFLRKIVFCKAGERWRARKKIPFFALFILTVPVIMQIHMAVLPYSLASSLLMILAAKVFDFWLPDYKFPARDGVGIILLWVLASQICPEYGWFSGVIVGIGSVGYILVQKKKAWKPILILLISVISITTCNATLQTPGSMGKIQKSWQASMMTRVVWPNYGKFSYFWKEEIRQRWDDIALRELSTYPEKIIYEFGPEIENMFGREEANSIYFEMVKRTLQLDTKNIAMGILKDGAAYICPPITAHMQLHGVGASYTGWNYGRMKDYTPQLTRYYVEYGLYAWLFIVIVDMVLWLLSAFHRVWKSREEKKRSRRILCYLASLSLSVNLGYVLISGNMQDYKKVIVCSVLCTMLLISLLKAWEESTSAS